MRQEKENIKYEEISMTYMIKNKNITKFYQNLFLLKCVFSDKGISKWKYETTDKV